MRHVVIAATDHALTTSNTVMATDYAWKAMAHEAVHSLLVHRLCVTRTADEGLMSTDHAHFTAMNLLHSDHSLPIMRPSGSADHKQRLPSATDHAGKTSGNGKGSTPLP